MLLEARISKGKDGITTCYTVDATGLKQGIYLQYRKDTTVKLLCHYENDMLHGSYSVYYPTGELQTKEEYKNNLLDGEQLYYQKDKLLLQITSNGKKISEQIFECRYTRGNTSKKQILQQSTEFNPNGNIHGNVIEYYKDGKTVQRCKKYNDGTLVEDSSYNSKGSRISHTLYTGSGYTKTELQQRYSYTANSVTIKADDLLTETINYTIPADPVRLQQLFAITKYSYQDKIPKELWNKINEECVTHRTTAGKVTTYKVVDPHSLYRVSVIKTTHEIVYRWAYSYETGTLENKKKTGEYTKELIELSAVYNLLDGTCNVSKHTVRKEEKYYVAGKAFGFFRTTEGQAVKEYFRAGTRNLNWSDAVDMFGKESNNELTEADIMFVKLKYN